MKVLLVKMSSLGDVVHALPAVTDAARNGVRFHWVVEEAFQAVPAAHPAVEKVLPIAWRRWRRRLWRSRGEMRGFFELLAGERYDLAIDSQGLVKSALAMKGARVRERIGFCRDSARESLAAGFYDRCVSVPRRLHAVERQRRLFSGALGYVCDAAEDIDFGLEPLGRGQTAESSPHGRSAQRNRNRPVTEPAGDLATEPAADRPERGRNTIAPYTNPETATERCLLLHGATWATKLWPDAMWVQLARMATEAGFEPALPWGNVEERARAKRIAEASGASLLPMLGLEELMDELRAARVAVGADSGLAHLAGALGVPTVVLYGSTSRELTGCRGRRVRNLQADFPCAPCLSGTCRYRGPAVHWRGTPVTPPCYGKLDPERVWAVVSETMDAHSLLHI